MANQFSSNEDRSRNAVKVFGNGVDAFDAAFGKDKRGREWNYISNGGVITGVMIGYHLGYDIIGSIVFQSVDKDGNIQYSDVIGSYHGIGAGDTVVKVIFDWPREYLSSVKVWFKDHCGSITGISFRTNKKRYGPYKPPKASLTSPFEFQSDDKVIVGFYGKEYYDANGRDKHLISGLGVYTKHSHEISKVPKPRPLVVGSLDAKDCIKSGLCGWSDSLNKDWTYILKGPTEIKIGYNDKYIQSMSFKSTPDEDDPGFECAQTSDPDVIKEETISLDFPKEHLVAISGTTRTLEEDIESICFCTNKKIYGPFGSFKGNRFRFYAENGSIVGFHGRCGELFSAFGVYTISYSPKKDIINPTKGKPIEKIEASGGYGGKEWDYKPKGAITEITVQHGWIIDSISFKSSDGNNSDKYGASGGGKKSVISINWPNEYLRSITGTHNIFYNRDVVESLYFHTNIKSYGPFGRENGSPFDFSLKDGSIVGFHGRHDDYIDAIGVYYEKPHA